MAWSVSDRRRLRTWLAAVFFGGLVGYAYVLVMGPLRLMQHEQASAGEAFRGFRAGMIIAGLAVGFELYGMRTRFGDWLRRFSFIPAFLVREAILATIIVASLLVNVALSRWLDGERLIVSYPSIISSSMPHSPSPYAD